MAFGIDYAFGGTPNPAALAAAGVTFVCRYVSTPGNPKNLTRPEADKLRAHGIKIIVVFETTANRALAGQAAGFADARSAYAQARMCGAPALAPIYFAVDFDATEAQQSAINAYLRGAAQALGWENVGVYGGYHVVKRCLDAKVCKYAWQTYAWSGGQWDPRAHLQQYSNGHNLAGVSCDYNRSTVKDFGQWDGRVLTASAPPKPKPVPFQPWRVTITEHDGRVHSFKARYPSLDLIRQRVFSRKPKSVTVGPF